jgi:hypothetical protein
MIDGEATALTRSLALARTPWVAGAIAGITVAIAAVAFLAGHAAAPTRIGELPQPARAPALPAAVVRLGDTTAPALPTLRNAPAKPSRSHAAKPKSSTPPAKTKSPTPPAPAPTTPGYTIVGG